MAFLRHKGWRFNDDYGTLFSRHDWDGVGGGRGDIEKSDLVELGSGWKEPFL